MIVLPGQKLASIAMGASEEGTFIHGEHILASRMGELKVNSVKKENGLQFQSYSVSPLTKMTIPVVGNVIVGMVSKISPRLASVKILLVENETTSIAGFQGIIRVKDIHVPNTELKKQGKGQQVILEQNQNLEAAHSMAAAFKCGDIVKARIIALGEGNIYYLTTAEEGLGTLFHSHTAAFDYP